MGFNQPVVAVACGLYYLVLIVFVAIAPHRPLSVLAVYMFSSVLKRVMMHCTKHNYIYLYIETVTYATRQKTSRIMSPAGPRMPQSTTTQRNNNNNRNT